MLLPQTKEREYRFKLALRMGLPIFGLILALVLHTVLENSQTLQISFYVESLILLVFSIYFILYLIYTGFTVKITDDVSKTFTREYLFSYLKEELKREKEYTLILISIDNLQDINTLYGMKNGDNVLEKVALWVADYLKNQSIENFPLGHIKGGDFILGLKGIESDYTTMLDLMCLKSDEFKVDDIEIKLSSSISDSHYSQELDYIVENLFELQEQKRDFKRAQKDEEINPNELESFVINAIDNCHLSIMTQDVFLENKRSFRECFIKLKSPEGKLLYPKSYMKVINKLGLGVKYDLMVLEALLYSAKIEENSIYALNISPTSLRNEKFLHTIRELLKESKIKIMFILSETEYFSHISRYNNILSSLKRSGVLITVDRLGTIHTSFLYLRELKIDFIRFDTYYSNAERIKDNRAIIDGFNLMAHEKGVKTWMKNITNRETLEFVDSLKIDYLQGKELSSLELIYEKKV